MSSGVTGQQPTDSTPQRREVQVQVLGGQLIIMDYKRHADELLNGKTVSFRPKGNSMEPKISSGDLVTVEPFTEKDPRIPIAEKGDIVFCRVGRNYYVHLVQAVKGKLGDCRYQSGNNHNPTHGTIGRANRFGKVIRVEK